MSVASSLSLPSLSLPSRVPSNKHSSSQVPTPSLLSSTLSKSSTQSTWLASTFSSPPLADRSRTALSEVWSSTPSSPFGNEQEHRQPVYSSSSASSSVSPDANESISSNANESMS